MEILDPIRKILRPDRARTREGIRRRKPARRLRKQIGHEIRDALLIVLGVISAGFGLRGFLMPNALIDGGVTGISLLVNRETAIPLSLLLLILNIPLLFLAIKPSTKFLA
jgi:hypothetical protein